MPKLDEEQVFAMRRMRAKFGTPLSDLAKIFKISVSHAGHVCRGDLGSGWANSIGPITKRKKRPDGAGREIDVERAIRRKMKIEARKAMGGISTSKFDRTESTVLSNRIKVRKDLAIAE